LAQISIRDLHYWIEKDQFFVVGICSNESNRWQEAYLKMDPLNASGQPVQMNGTASNVFTTFAQYLPPRGRSAFFAFWPLSAFSSKPDSCLVMGAGATSPPPGHIVLAEETSAVKMKTNNADPALAESWLVSTVLNNPFDVPAAHPRLELLLYGTDNRLWMATLLNPENPDQRKQLGMDKEGPLAPGEKRHVGCNVFYGNLPKGLQDAKIAKAEFLAFVAHQ
jgi:hypothetical protein